MARRESAISEFKQFLEVISSYTSVMPDLEELSRFVLGDLATEVPAELSVQNRVCAQTGCTCTKPVVAMIILCGHCSPKEHLGRMENLVIDIRQDKMWIIEHEETGRPV
jgi:hypothetical protein